MVHKAANDSSGFGSTTKSAGTKTTITVTPGPHLFTIRYGKDSGGTTAMGPFYAANATNFTWAAYSGLMLDRFGRDSTDIADYARIEDPGDA